MSFLPGPLPLVAGFPSEAGCLQKRCGSEGHGGDVVSDFRAVLLELGLLGGGVPVEAVDAVLGRVYLWTVFVVVFLAAMLACGVGPAVSGGFFAAFPAGWRPPSEELLLHLCQVRGEVECEPPVSCPERLGLGGLGVAHDAEPVVERVEGHDAVAPHAEFLLWA